MKKMLTKGKLCYKPNIILILILSFILFWRLGMLRALSPEK